MHRRLLFYTSCALLLAALGLSGCLKSSHNTPTPSRKLFTLSTDDTYKTDLTDNWVVLNDANGDVIDFIPFESGTTVFFVSSKVLPGTTITATLISHKVGPGSKNNYTVSSYFDIPIGDSVGISQYQSPAHVLAGTFTVSITGVSLQEAHLSDALLNESGYALGPTSINMTANVLYGYRNFHLSVRSSTGEWKHKYFSNVQVGDNYALTWSDLEDFDQVVSFTFPPTDDMTLSVIGKEIGQTVGLGYQTSLYFPTSSVETATAGYLNSLTGYQTSLYLRYSTHAYQYLRYGGVPGTITWPNHDQFALNKTGFMDYQSTAAGTFQYRSSAWFFSNSTTQIICYAMSSSASQVLKGLPRDLLSQYPDLDLTQPQHSYSDFYTLAPSYEEAIGVTLKGQSWPDPTEILSVRLP